MRLKPQICAGLFTGCWANVSLVRCNLYWGMLRWRGGQVWVEIVWGGWREIVSWRLARSGRLGLLGVVLRGCSYRTYSRMGDPCSPWPAKCNICFWLFFSPGSLPFPPQLGTSWVFNVRKHICVLSASACAPSEKSSALQFMQIFHSDSSSTFEEDYNKQHQKRGLFKLSSPYLLEWRDQIRRKQRLETAWWWFP